MFEENETDLSNSAPDAVDESQTNEVEAQEGDTSTPDEGSSQADAPVVFDDRQQEKVNQIVSAKTAKMHEERKRADELQRQLDEVRKQIPQEERPVIPDFPDQFDDDYENKLRERDQALLKAAEYDAREKARQEIEQRQQQDVIAAQQKELAETANRFVASGAENGLTREGLAQSADTVSQAGVSVDVQEFILHEKNGPVVLDYLSKNPLELDALARMSPMDAAIHIRTEISKRLPSAKTKSDAPPPADVLNGGGSPARERGPSGATFE